MPVDGGVLVTGARAPVALHWAWALRAAGRRVVLADALRWPIGAGRGCADAYARHAPPVQDREGFRRDILAICRAHRIGLILPTCEEVFWLAQIAPDLAAAGVRLFAPGLDLLARVHDKGAFIEACAGVWPHLPATRALTSRAEVAALGDARGLVLKPAFSRFATRTLICPRPRELASVRPTPRAPWVAQAFLPGREVCVFAIAVGGRVTALSAYHPAYRAGRGAAVYFQPVDPGPALAFVSAFAAATGWTGQVSFDMIEVGSGPTLALAPIECNPRATSGLHLVRDAGALVAALEGGGPVLVPGDAPPQCVPLAMWLYAGWANRGRLAAFRADLARARPALDWGGVRVGVGAQLRAVAEIAGRAAWHRQGLLDASTRDIAWDG